VTANETIRKNNLISRAKNSVMRNFAAYASHISPDAATADTLQAVKMGWTCSLRGQEKLMHELVGKPF
jgi:hypothetical protein